LKGNRLYNTGKKREILAGMEGQKSSEILKIKGTWARGPIRRRGPN